MTNFAINYGGKLLSGELPEIEAHEDGEFCIFDVDGDREYVGGDVDDLKHEMLNLLAVVAAIEGKQDAEELVKVDAAARVIYAAVSQSWLLWDELNPEAKEDYRKIAREAADAAHAVSA